MKEIVLNETARRTTAVVRETAALGQLSVFFDRAFFATMAALQKKGQHPAGPPCAKCNGMPAGTIEASNPRLEPDSTAWRTRLILPFIKPELRGESEQGVGPA